jgi:hypothetical protein
MKTSERFALKSSLLIESDRKEIDLSVLVSFTDAF